MSIIVNCMTGLTITEKDSLDDIGNRKRKNAGRKPVISTDKNKEMIKDIILNKSLHTFGYLKNTWSIRLLATYLSSLLEMNECQSNANVEDNSGFRYCIQTTKT